MESQSGQRPSVSRGWWWVIFIAVAATLLITPPLTTDLEPPARGYILVAEVIVLVLIFVILVARFKLRSSLSAFGGVFSAVITISGLTLFVPAAAPYYGGALDDLFSYDPCSSKRPTRVFLTVDGQAPVLRATYDVRIAAEVGEYFWIVLFSQNSNPQMYFAKNQLEPMQSTAGAHEVLVDLGVKAGPDSSRKVWVACANAHGNAGLLDYQKHVDDESWHNLRRDLPAGVVLISNGVQHPPLRQ